MRLDRASHCWSLSESTVDPCWSSLLAQRRAGVRTKIGLGARHVRGVWSASSCDGEPAIDCDLRFSCANFWWRGLRGRRLVAECEFPGFRGALPLSIRVLVKPEESQSNSVRRVFGSSLSTALFPATASSKPQRGIPQPTAKPDRARSLIVSVPPANVSFCPGEENQL